MSSPRRRGELLRLVVFNSSITLRKNPAASAISRKAGSVSTRKLLAPKFSIPIPIFCRVATLRSTHSASRGGNEKICGNNMRGVLVHQNEPVGIFHQHVKTAEHADDLKLLIMPRFDLRFRTIAINRL